MAARRDYENARKNASKENTKVGDDEGYLNPVSYTHLTLPTIPDV